MLCSLPYKRFRLLCRPVSKKLDIVKFLHNDEISFVNLCYNEVDNLKVDLNEFQRGKLHEILRQVAYEQFLTAVKIIEQTEAQP
ncbi:hypothetical protein [Nostoc sp. ChiQUE01b]|uniref:hypothetical protein n=1 Tax=Nostoc sp. ChiQUE01b TaxID=3075376 RepID=UPI002AD41E39|nr:hypothetical protein [Nostoc sp. ChiQUE01b]